MADNSIYASVRAYLLTSYREQAADERIKWTQDHDRLVEQEAQSLYERVAQTVEDYMNSEAEPLPDNDDRED